MSRTRGALLGLAVMGAALAGLPASTAVGSVAPGAVVAQEELPELGLVRQSPTVPPGGTFDAWLAGAQLPPDGSVEVVIHNRVRSRSELAASTEGQRLRTTVYSIRDFVSALPTGPAGSRRISVSLDPAAPAGVPLTTGGVYPVRIVARDATDAPVASLITHLLLEPRSADESPPLSVAVVARVGGVASLEPDGTVEVDQADLEALTKWATVLAQATAPVNVAASPAGIDALARQGGPAATAALQQLRALAGAGGTVALPYAPTSPDGLVQAGLSSELAAHRQRGADVLADVLGAEPDTSTWIAGPDLGQTGLDALRELGVRHIVVDPDQVEPLRSGLLSLSLAQPFILGDDDEEPAVDGLAIDPGILGQLDSDAAVGTEASRVLAELAMVWYERPGVARSIVLPVDPSVRGEVVAQIVAGLAQGRLFAPGSLADAFETAAPLEQPGGGRVDRDLAPDEPDVIDAAVRQQLPATRRALTGFATLLDTDDTAISEAEAHLLLATSTAGSRREREAHRVAAQALIDGVTAAISAPDRETITLTAREGTVPLTLRNDGESTVHAVVHLRSPKLEFPDGSTIAVDLPPGSTRMDIAVKTLASGSFPLVVEVTSPDGTLLLASVDYSIQSTAVSGLGVVLSAGAAVFLIVWWARHWSRTRRSAKLVEAKHLAASTAADE